MKAALLEIANIPASWCDVIIVLVYAPAVASLSLGLRSWPIWLRVMVLLGASGVGLQCLVEGARWQLIPALILSGELIFICSITFLREIPVPSTLGGVGCIAFGAAMASYCIFPSFGLPKPSGAYPVGTVVLHLVDHNRRETLGGDGNDYRELMVQMWYPAMRSDLDQARPSSFLRRRGRSALNAELSGAKGAYPILIFSPSWHGQRGQNLFQVEDLASHGFVVIGIDHPYSSRITVFPDGRVARAKPVQFWDLSSDQALQASNRHNETVVRIRVADVEFLLAELERLNREGSGSKFSERLDLSRLGVFGYSFGGAVAAQACWQDQRFKAGIDMDGTLYGEVADAGVSQPFMFMVETTKPPARARLDSANPEKRRFARLLERDFEEQRNSMERHGGFWLGISGVQHANFTDPPAFPTVGYYLEEAGTINPVRAMRIVNAYTLAFFERYVNNIPEPLLDRQSSSYPEVEFAWPLDIKRAG